MCVQPDDVLWPKKPAPKKKTVKQRPKAPKSTTQETFVTIPGGEGWSNVAHTVNIHPTLWVEDLPVQLFKLARAGVTGNVLKKDIIEYSPLEASIYYAMLRPLLEEGQQIRVLYKPNQWKKRLFVETDLGRIEKICNFENFNKTTGFANTRKATKKSTTFHNVVIRIEATHTQTFAKPGKPEKQKAQFKVTIASLNPLATTVFPPEFERTTSNTDVLRRYLQSFPIRLHRSGYDVSSELKNICKEISKKRKRGSTANEGQS